MNIAYLTNMLSKPTDSGGNIHVMQVADHLLAKGHRLYTNLQHEREDFVKFDPNDLDKLGAEIDVFYIRIHGHHKNDELTKLRHSNPSAPCIWEINAPLEELMVNGVSLAEFQKLDQVRKDFAKLVDGAICVSHEMEDYAISQLGIPFTACVPNGSDLEKFKYRPENRESDSFKVIWVGSPKFPWQGYNTVKKAAEITYGKDSSIKFIVTAEGESTPNVEFVGHVPYQDLPTLMATADVGLCIYEEISFYKEFFFSPLKMYDYMASGLPIIGTNLGQIRKVVQETKNGLLVNNIDELVQSILHMKSHPELSVTYGTRSRAAAETYYNWERVSSEVERFLKKVIMLKKHGQRNAEYHNMYDYVSRLEVALEDKDALFNQTLDSKYPMFASSAHKLMSKLF